MLKFLKKLEDNGVLSLIDVLVTIGWYGYVCRLLADLDIGVVPKSILVLVGAYFAFDRFVMRHIINAE